MTAAVATRTPLHEHVLARIADAPYVQLRGLIRAGQLGLNRPARWITTDAEWYLLIAEAYGEARRREAAATHPWDVS